MSRAPGYGKIYTYGSVNAPTFDSDLDIHIEEKFDGSQFSYMLAHDSTLFCWSKNEQLDLDVVLQNSKHLFHEAVKLAFEKRKTPGVVYICEYFKRGKHNRLNYNFITEPTLIVLNAFNVFDHIWMANETPCLAQQPWKNLKLHLDCFLINKSKFGECQIEGIVLKQYSKDMKEMKMAKIVNQEFKEISTHKIKSEHYEETLHSLAIKLVEKYRTEARFYKAIQHLTESGVVINDMKDVSAVIKELHHDIVAECNDDMRQIFEEQLTKLIKRHIGKNVATWLQNYLMTKDNDET